MDAAVLHSTLRTERGDILCGFMGEIIDAEFKSLKARVGLEFNGYKGRTRRTITRTHESDWQVSISAQNVDSSPCRQLDHTAMNAASEQEARRSAHPSIISIRSGDCRNSAPGRVVSHTYAETEEGLFPMCGYGWNRSDGKAFSIFRGSPEPRAAASDARRT